MINHTGHKLISGYPEGRRMWLNIKWYDGTGQLLREDGKYGPLEVAWDASGNGNGFGGGVSGGHGNGEGDGTSPAANGYGGADAAPGPGPDAVPGPGNGGNR